MKLLIWYLRYIGVGEGGKGASYPDKSETYPGNFENIPANLKMKTLFHTNPMRKRENFSWKYFVLNIRADSFRLPPHLQTVLLFYSHTSVGYTVNLWYRYTYTVTSYRAGVLLRYYRTGMQRAELPPCPPLPPSWQNVRKAANLCSGTPGYLRKNLYVVF